MKFINISILFIGVFLFSCTESNQHFLIPEDEMIDILVDIHVADGVLKTETFPYDSLQLRAENYYKNVFYKYHINRVLFDSALSQYTQDRMLYIDMYDKVIERLRTKESYIRVEEMDTLNSTTDANLFSANYKTDYEGNHGIIRNPIHKISQERAKSGRSSYKAGGDVYEQKYSHILNQPVEEIEFQLTTDIFFEKLPKNLPQIVFSLEKEDKILAEQNIKINSFVKTDAIWNKINVTVKLSLKTPEDKVSVKVFFLNKKRNIFYLDDYSLKIKQIK